MDNAQARIVAIRDAGEQVTADELDRIWAALETVRPEEISGRWKGSALSTGHPVESMLIGANWHGKAFHTTDHVEPLICRDSDGALYSHKELAQGDASLWMVEFRGEVTATMVYDGRPILDHFKRIDDHTLLGCMNGKEVLDQDGRHFYFVLERE